MKNSHSPNKDRQASESALSSSDVDARQKQDTLERQQDSALEESQRVDSSSESEVTSAIEVRRRSGESYNRRRFQLQLYRDRDRDTVGDRARTIAHVCEPDRPRQCSAQRSDDYLVLVIVEVKLAARVPPMPILLHQHQQP